MRLRKRGLSLRPHVSHPIWRRFAFKNALVLFDEFVHQHHQTPDAATLRGQEGVL